MEIPRIKCFVEDCSYCDNLSNTCILSSITISNIRKKNKCSKENTFCDNYRKMNLK